ncbi:MAG: hypothetical protein AAGI28_04775 [Pseudomonadota bacterium]
MKRNKSTVPLILLGAAAACSSEEPPEVAEQIIVRERGASEASEQEPAQADLAESPVLVSE